MSHDIDPSHEDLIDAYLHGRLDGPARDALERQIRDDAALSGQLAQQRKLDAALQRLFAPPAAEQLLARILAERTRPAGRAPPSRGRAWFLRGLAAAAAIALVATGLWWFRSPTPPIQRFAAAPPRALDVIYREEVADGLTPMWICKDDQEFASAYWYVLGQGLLLQKPLNDVVPVGMSFGRAITPKTLYLLIKVGDDAVIVFADRREADAAQSIPPESGLKLFRKEIGQLVLYEVTPRNTEAVLPLLYEPDMPAEWKKPPPYPGLPR